MTTKRISNGVVHTIPADMRGLFATAPNLHTIWENLTPLARNEWICWVESAKQIETRARRMRIMTENLAAGKRRPCCWAGCPHR